MPNFLRTMICAWLCKHCRAGRPLVWRAETREFTHSFVVGGVFTHCMCAAHAFRMRWPERDKE